MSATAIFSRNGSIVKQIEPMIAALGLSLDAALYRYNHPDLEKALEDAVQRRVVVRLIIDGQKYDGDSMTRQLLKRSIIPYRLSHGRNGAKSKMHHKFAILDNRDVITGSYNWTLESENDNYENLIVLRDTDQVEAYRREFELLWKEAVPVGD